MSATISFKNELNESVIVYDSYFKSSKPSLMNYFGTLTKIGVIEANQTKSFSPTNKYYCVFVVCSQKDNTPIARFAYFLFKDRRKEYENNPFRITKENLIQMTQALDFVKFILSHVKNPKTKQFHKLWKQNSENISALIKSVNKYFKDSDKYKQVTFVAYRMALAYYYHELIIKKKGLETSSGHLFKIFGIPGLDNTPSLNLKHVHLEIEDGALVLKGTLNLSEVPNLRGWNKVAHWFNNLNEFCYIILSPMVIEFIFYFTTNKVKIPTIKGKHILLTEPKLILSYNPKPFEFWEIEIMGDFYFKLFGKQFKEVLSAALTPEQLSLGLNISGDNILTLPIAKEVHIDSFGLEGGIFFEPPGADFGITGKFHIGEYGKIPIEDNSFGIVLDIEGEVVTPMYLSFYLPRLTLNQVVEIFTNKSSNISSPIELTNISFYDAMEAVVLPDGTMPDMGFGFNAVVNIFGFSFMGGFKITFDTGIHADVQCNPIKLGHLLSIRGEGKKVTILLDKNGHPVKNNKIHPHSKKKLLPHTKKKVLVEAGGPVLHIATDKAPYFYLNIQASFLDILKRKVTAQIDNKGISFKLTKEIFTLKNGLNFLIRYDKTYSCRIEFVFGFDKQPIEVKKGITINVTADVFAGIELGYAKNDLYALADVGFDFKGVRCKIGQAKISLDIRKVEHLIREVVKVIEKNAEELLGPVWKDAKKLAALVKKDLVKLEKELVVILEAPPFNMAAQKIAHLMHDAGFTVDKIAKDLKTASNINPKELVTIFKKPPFNMDLKKAISLMQKLEYGVDKITTSLKEVWKLTEKETVKVLTSSPFNLSSSKTAQIMHKAGYAVEEIFKALKNISKLGEQEAAKLLKEPPLNKTAKDAANIMYKAGYELDEITKGLKSAWNFSANEMAELLKKVPWKVGAEAVVKAMKAADYGIKETSEALKSAWNYGINEVAKETKKIVSGAASGIKSVGSKLKDAFDF